MNMKSCNGVLSPYPPSLLTPNKSRQSRQGPSRPKRERGPRARAPAARSQAPVTAVSRSDLSTVVRMVQTPLFAARSKHKMLPYYSNASLTAPVTGLGVGYVYSANGLYDPDISGTGTQPMGFDQMMVFYEHYTVFSARIRVTFRNFSTAISPIVYIAARGDTVVFTSPEQIMETGNSVSTQLLPANITGSLKELTMTVRCAAFLGFDDLMDSNVARGDIASNPAEGVFFHVGCFNNEASATGVVQFQVRIEYDAVFSEARVITPSLSRRIRALLVEPQDLESKATQPQAPSAPGASWSFLSNHR